MLIRIRKYISFNSIWFSTGGCSIGGCGKISEMPIWRPDGKFDHWKTFTPICQHNFHRKRNKYRPLKSLICLLNPHLSLTPCHTRISLTHIILWHEVTMSLKNSIIEDVYNRWLSSVICKQLCIDFDAR